MTPERLDTLPDRAARVRESARFLRYAESRTVDGRAARNAEVRAGKAEGMTRRELADLCDLSEDAVKAILR